MTRAKSIISNALRALKTWFLRFWKAKRQNQRIRFTMSTIWREIIKTKKVDKISINAYANYINQFKKICRRYQEGQIHLTDPSAEECLLCDEHVNQLTISGNDENVLRKLAESNWSTMTAAERQPFVALAELKRDWLSNNNVMQKLHNSSKVFKRYARCDKTIAPTAYKYHDAEVLCPIKRRRKRKKLYCVSKKRKYRMKFNREKKSANNVSEQIQITVQPQIDTANEETETLSAEKKSKRRTNRKTAKYNGYPNTEDANKVEPALQCNKMNGRKRYKTEPLESSRPCKMPKLVIPKSVLEHLPICEDNSTNVKQKHISSDPVIIRRLRNRCIYAPNHEMTEYADKNNGCGNLADVEKLILEALGKQNCREFSRDITPVIPSIDTLKSPKRRKKM